MSIGFIQDKDRTKYMSIAVTKQDYDEWMTSACTLKFMKKLKEEREQMKEGLVNDIYEHPEVVKGMCKSIALILNLEYEDLHEPKYDSQRNQSSGTQDSDPA